MAFDYASIASSAADLLTAAGAVVPLMHPVIIGPFNELTQSWPTEMQLAGTVPVACVGAKDKPLNGTLRNMRYFIVAAVPGSAGIEPGWAINWSGRDLSILLMEPTDPNQTPVIYEAYTEN